MLLRVARFLSVCWLSLSCGCARTEEPAAPPPQPESSAQAGSGGVAPSRGGGGLPVPPPSSAPAPCTVPFGSPAPVAAKAPQCPQDPTGNLTLPLGRVTFVDAPSAPSVEVELARDDASRARGLMYRTSMPEDSGMLFSWPDERVRSFWMRNTCIPLDLLYITKDGYISGILEQVPTMNEAPRRVPCPVAHVLELNAGWARAHGVAPGMKVSIEH